MRFNILIFYFEFNLVYKRKINEMSSFKSKAQFIKSKLNQENLKENLNHACSHQQLRITRQKTVDNAESQKILIQEPIIIEKKTVSKMESSRRKKTVDNIDKNIPKRDVQPFVPVNIPPRDRKLTEKIQQKVTSTKKVQGTNKQIEIQIEQDDKNKDCLKKLFKKIHKLTEDLKESESQRIRLKLELENYESRQKKGNDYERKINGLECEKYKLEVELQMLRKLLAERNAEVERHRSAVPKEIIKQVVVEKPVQVIVQVPKPVPGPQRIVQKIVQVPKYVEVQKQVTVQVPRQIVKTIQVPTVTQKVVYVDKPVYIDRQVPVHVDRPIQVPIQKPIYIDRPYVQQELLERLKKYQLQIDNLMRINAELDNQNRGLQITCDQLSENIEILRRHNEEKNREVQHLLQNSIDYNPCSPSQDYSLGSVKYTISSKNHKRVI